ncbi:MAG: hypothetical protein ABL993_11325 [Vicinamibacterales bacterium]
MSSLEPVSVDEVMTELRDRVRERVRNDVLRHGASRALEDPALFADVDALLRQATEKSQPAALLLPELLGQPDTWRLDTAMRYQSHRGGQRAAFIVFVKRRLLMPLFRWLFEYSRDNFERQQRVNQVLFACVQELAIETTRLRRELQRRGPSTRSGRPDSLDSR